MLNIIQNTIGAIRRVGESVVRAGLKMWLPFTKAEPLGENLVVNGDFSTDSDWTVSTQSDISSGKARILSTDGSHQYIQQSNSGFTNTQGKFVKITLDIVEYVSGTIKAQFSGGSNYSFPQSIGTHTLYVQNDGSAGTFNIARVSGVTDITIDNVSVEEYAQETPDISGNDNNAILKTGKALQFSGNDSVQTSFPSSYTIKTIAFWINPTHSSTNEVVFYGGGAMAGTRELRLDHLQLEAINSNITMSTYVNGTLEGVTSGGTPATLTQDDWQRVVLTSSAGFSVVSDTFDIGSGLYGSDGRFIMSDLQIYDETWTTDDIAYDYANPQKLVTDSEDTSITLDNLKAWWHLSEGDGTIAFDSAPLIGKELILNGDFNNGTTNWAKQGNSDFEVVDAYGKTSTLHVEILDNTSSSRVVQSFDFVQGRTYKILVDVYLVSGNFRVDTSNSFVETDFVNFSTPNQWTTLEGTFTSLLTGSSDIFLRASNNVSEFYVDSISIKEVFNIDGETYDGSSLGASYVDAQERIPQLGMMNWSKGSNLLTYSEDFSESEWSKVSSPTLESGYLAPDGTMTAYKITNGISNSHIVDLNVQTTSDRKTKSLWARTVSGTGVVSLLNYYGNNNSQYTLTEEWQRVEVSGTLSTNEHFYLVDFRHASNTLDEVIVWGAQLEADDGSVTAYRRTNGTAVTDATLISSATDSQKDILGNAVRVKGSGFNLDGTGYGEVLDNNVFDIPASSTQNGGAFSICGWAKWKHVLQPHFQSTLNTIYSNGLTATDINSFSINARLEAGNNIANAFISGTALNGSTTYTQGEWFYFALTREETTGSCKLYTSRIDGNGQWIVALDGTATNTNSLTNSGNKTIGWDGTTNDRRYNERIDDIKFYDRELSLDEIEQNFNATKSGHNN